MFVNPHLGLVLLGFQGLASILLILMGCWGLCSKPTDPTVATEVVETRNPTSVHPYLQFQDSWLDISRQPSNHNIKIRAPPTTRIPLNYS